MFYKCLTIILCLNINGTHVTANNSTNNYVFFFVSDLKIVEQLSILDHNAYFASLLSWR